ncbi:hypothetical protein [Acinetobacter nosocomialis]|uniref:hypothetical protein n=1 Tax=Acinetobacter nosocomialis TaxID=106654 RepID=UPI003F4C3747
MDKCREEFQKAFPIPAHWIEFDEKANRYYCPYVADATASKYQSQWVVWQHQQAKVEELEGKLKQAYEDVDTFAEAHERECGFKAQLAKDKAELQKRLYGALKETQYALQYVEGDMRGNHEFLQMAMIRTFKALEQVLKGEGL